MSETDPHHVLVDDVTTGPDELIRDVVVIGGGAAGLSAALLLASARLHVTVVDSGAPRHAPAGGRMLAARCLLVTTGIRDELPKVPGVAQRWGRDVVRCLYCHGHEVRDEALGVLATQSASVHQALLVRQWSHDVVLFEHTYALSEAEREQLTAGPGHPDRAGRSQGAPGAQQHAVWSPDRRRFRRGVQGRGLRLSPVCRQNRSGQRAGLRYRRQRVHRRGRDRSDQHARRVGGRRGQP